MARLSDEQIKLARVSGLDNVLPTRDWIDTIDALRAELAEAVSLAVAGAYLDAAEHVPIIRISGALMWIDCDCGVIQAWKTHITSLTPAEAKAALMKARRESYEAGCDELNKSILMAERDAEVKDYYEAILAMTVARLGGKVEGYPTQRINFLQRIDALVKIETEKDATIERLKTELADAKRGMREGAASLCNIAATSGSGNDLLGRAMALELAEAIRKLPIDAAKGGSQP